MEFQKTPIPTATYANGNPYLEVVKEIIDGEEARTFTHTVSTGGVRKDFDKIKRELQAAGTALDVTVRSHIYDAETGAKFILPSEKGAVLKFVGSTKTDPHKVKSFKVTFWVTDKIIRGEEVVDEEEGEEEEGQGEDE